MYKILEIQCSNPGPIPNGRREGNSFTVGSEMRYFCDQDHTLVGSSVSVCTTAGTWSHPTPACQGTSFITFIIIMVIVVKWGYCMSGLSFW